MHTQLKIDAPQASQEFYTGTVNAAAGVASSTIVGPSLWRPEAERALDGGRPAATMPLRSSAVWAASSVRDATAIAAIRAYSRTRFAPYEAIHMYRVRLVPLHIGPVAVIDVLHERLSAGAETAAMKPLIRAYWEPTGIWNLLEVLAQSLTILEELPTTSERDIYIRRWVHYNVDRERAEALSPLGSNLTPKSES